MPKPSTSINVPPAPDPAATIAAQAEANRINQITPQGSLFFGTLQPSATVPAPVATAQNPLGTAPVAPPPAAGGVPTPAVIPTANAARINEILAANYAPGTIVQSTASGFASDVPFEQELQFLGYVPSGVGGGGAAPAAPLALPGFAPSPSGFPQAQGGTQSAADFLGLASQQLNAEQNPGGGKGGAPPPSPTAVSERAALLASQQAPVQQAPSMGLPQSQQFPSAVPLGGGAPAGVPSPAAAAAGITPSGGAIPVPLGGPPIGSAPPFDVGGGLAFAPNLGSQTALVQETPFQQQFRGLTEGVATTLGGGALNAATQLPNTPLTTAGLPPLPTSINGGGGGGGGGGLPPLQTSIPESALPPLPVGIGDNLPFIPTTIDVSNLPNLPTSVDLSQAPPIEMLDFSGLPGLATNADLLAASQPLEQATFQRGVNLLTPEFAKRENRLSQTFANTGNPIGSEQANEALRLNAQFQNEALGNLAFDAIGAGRQEQSRLFGQSLQTRQQGLSEMLSDATLTLAQRQQIVDEILRNAALAGQTRGQLFGEQVTGTDVARLGRGQLFGEGLAEAGLGQQARAQRFSELLAGTGLSASARGQLTNESLANAGLSQSARQIGFQERTAVRGQQFNELATLLGLSAVPQPSLTNFIAPGQVDVIGAQQQALGQGNLAAQLAAQNAQAGKGGLFDLAGGLGAAAILSGSGGAAAPAAPFLFPSSRQFKHRGRPVSEILPRLDLLEIEAWDYLPGIEDGATHIGPYSEDFHALFDVGDSRYIHAVDGIGVALLGVKELHARVKHLEGIVDGAS